MNNPDELYGEIKQKLSEARLKELAQLVLDAYKGNKLGKMRSYADGLFPRDEHADLPLNRIFVKLIKIIHPDRFAAHLEAVEDAYARRDGDTLSFYRNMLLITATARRSYERRFAYDFTEEYRYGEEDFGYHTWEYADRDEEDAGGTGESFGTERAFGTGDAAQDVEDVEFDFIQAFKSEYLGNLSYTIGPADLAAIEGELNLAGYGMDETDGLQYCRNVNRLDLSHNRISNLYDLQGLVYLSELLLSDNRIEELEYLAGLENLEILDLSFNEIEDIGPLLTLDQLKFVDLRGNPLRSRKQMQQLTQRGVVVLL